VAVVADEIVESTREFILKRLAQELKGHHMAGFVATVLNTMGYSPRRAPDGAEGGRMHGGPGARRRNGHARRAGPVEPP